MPQREGSRLDRLQLETAVINYGAARLAVRNARTRTQFLNASADLWEAERALEDAAAMLTKVGAK